MVEPDRMVGFRPPQSGGGLGSGLPSAPDPKGGGARLPSMGTREAEKGTPAPALLERD